MNMHQAGLPDLFLQSLYVILHPFPRHDRTASDFGLIESKYVNVQPIEVGDVGIITYSRASNTPDNANSACWRDENLIGVTEFFLYYLLEDSPCNLGDPCSSNAF